MNMLKKITIHIYLFSLSFIAIGLNKINILSNLVLLEVSLAQLCVSILSGIYLFRFPSEKPKLSLEFILIGIAVYAYSVIDNMDFKLNWVNVFLYSLIFTIRDLTRLNLKNREIKVFKLFVSVLIFSLLYLCAPKILTLFFLPLFYFFIFYKNDIIYFDLSFNKSNLRYFIEDLPLVLFTYILSVQSFKSLTPKEYSNLRFYISLTSFSVVFQYLLFQYHYEGMIFFKKIEFKYTLLVLLLSLSLSYFFEVYEVGIILLVIYSGVHYFFLKSIKKVKYLFFLNSIPIIIIIYFIFFDKVNYYLYFLGIFISALVPIIFYHLHEIKNTSIPFREK